MPIKRAAYKDLRKAKKRHYKNISTKSDLHSTIKRFEALIAGKKTEEAKNLLKSIISKLDKAALKGILHRNSAARKVSRLTKRLSSLSRNSQ